MLHLHTSNRYEFLRAQLLDDLAVGMKGMSAPFAAQEVIIPSAGIRRDVELALAERLGICASVRFPFLAQWLWDRMAQFTPVQETSPFAPVRLTWRLYRIFNDKTWQAAHPRLHGYLNQADAAMVMELAAATAQLFDQYVTYRPDWLEAWSEKRSALPNASSKTQREDEAWQAEIWRQLLAQLVNHREHPSQAFFAELQRLSPAQIRAKGLPEQAHLFGLSTLPPLYLDILQRLSEWMEIHIYLLNPCREYWYDLLDAKRLTWLRQRELKRHPEREPDSKHEVGHPLLAAWGRQTQGLFQLLLAETRPTTVDEARFMAWGDSPVWQAYPELTPPLLCRVQDSFLDLTPPLPQTWPWAEDDDSIVIHVCHSLTRELEVLHDQLLALFATDDSLHPGDVLVVTPDLDKATPLIDAVFGTRKTIPYVITGRGETQINPVAKNLLAVLEVAGSRFVATQVFALLRQPPVATQFGLDEAALDQLQAALQEAGVHWGLDGKQRKAQNLPADPRHTWRDALARLLLGYALPSASSGTTANRQHPSAAFADLAPAAALHGGNAHALGQLWRFMNKLAELAEFSREPHTAPEWLKCWQKALDNFIAPLPELAEARRVVQEAMLELCTHMAEAEPSDVFPASVVRQALNGALDMATRGGVPTGAVTFTALPTLRHLPYAVICIVGLNDGVFPSQARPMEFDLTPLGARPGDRQRREDDRNLFLDLVLAARRRLYLSYTGKHERDNSALPPSILLAELRDFLLSATGAPSQRLLVHHPLQPFSPVYFSRSDAVGEAADSATRTASDPRLRSYDQKLAIALTAAYAARHTAQQAGLTAATHLTHSDEVDGIDGTDGEGESTDATWLLPPFFPEALPNVGEEWRQVTLAQLQRFYRHPAKYLLKERLGIELFMRDDTLNDAEPLVATWAERDALSARLLPAALAGADSQQLYKLAHSGPEAPSGLLGDEFIRHEVNTISDFAQYLQTWLNTDAGAPNEPLTWRGEFALANDNNSSETWAIHASLPPLYAIGQVYWRCGNANVHDFLQAWLAHLCLNSLAQSQPEKLGEIPRPIAAKTWIICRDGVWSFPELSTLPGYDVAALHRNLHDLLTAYRDGLHHPLPFYPRSAWAYLKGDEPNPKAAEGAWFGAYQREGEKSNPWWELALRGTPTQDLPPEFYELANTLFAPLRAALQAEVVES